MKIVIEQVSCNTWPHFSLLPETEVARRSRVLRQIIGGFSASAKERDILQYVEWLREPVELGEAETKLVATEFKDEEVADLAQQMRVLVHCYIPYPPLRR